MLGAEQETPPLCRGLLKDAGGRLRALVVVVLMLRMPVTVVEIIHMIAVFNVLVPAVLSVSVFCFGVLGLLVVTSHDDPPWTYGPRTGSSFQWSTGTRIWQCFCGTTRARPGPARSARFS